MSYSPYLSPGTPSGNSEKDITVVCHNEDCEECGEHVTVVQVYERGTGAAYIEPEEDAFCESCGEEMDDH